ncbi:putative nucleotidyltransferase with HDIG domain [Paenibacillus cellulosilyticus]|uniref:Putative nucleotidyltransferase with HDIG domain n=1 Tax=Paenibacillus cellulosilyticus TaxID=375489 RepID=A0A2V2YW39_9BACL|nr:HD-GYP domain-containing protein [Paenibacillus cellulosilyticus]PWW01154.1 putative nucleotidyltransferase with HDIG domain [Paenibacillus cellulosilyticus]QKS46883.1 HD-GYP domain-containing protein [Paenibacillus cellulosilyticus]
MRVHVTDLRDGDLLTSDTFNNYGLHVLSKDTHLSNKEISMLFQHQIDYVDIEVRASERPVLSAAGHSRTIETSVSPKWMPTVKPIYEDTVKGFKSLFEQAINEGTIEEKAVKATFQPLVDNFKMERDVVSMLLLLNTRDDYTYQHSVQVGMLSFYLASWLGYSQEEAVDIGQAGFLHDIGKCRIDGSILNKPGRLTEEEFDEIKRHPQYGHDIIKNSMSNEMAALVAAQHHERNDGSGYPLGLKDEEIHPVAKIVAVVDVYSAMISMRVYREKRDLLHVLREIYRMSFKELDANTAHTFIKHMIPNFIGKRAILDNGQSGIIVMTHPTEFFRPLIQIDEQFVDLTVERGIEVQEILL